MKNENGVYTGYQTEVIAQRGRSVAEVHIAQCDDGLYRMEIRFHYSYGGYCGPITDHGEGFLTYQQAKEAGIKRLSDKLHKPFPTEPDSVKAELADLRQQIESHMVQPSLF
jgi:hypothetical protein